LAKTVRHFLPHFPSALDRLPEPRNQDMLYFPRQTLIWSGILIFLLGLRSRRQFRFDADTSGFVANLNRLARCQVEMAPHDDTIVYYLERVNPKYFEPLPAQVVRRLIRMKALDRWRVRERFLVALDGTGQLFFRKRHCEHCLTQKVSNDQILYFHHVLEAKLVTANGLAFSIATEFIENEDPNADKQDCELKAFYRLAEKLKANFPQLPIILLADALYANDTVFEICDKNRWKFIFTFKEGSLPALFAEFQTLRELTPQNRTVHREGDIDQRFAWVNDLEYQGHRLSAFECREVRPEGKHYFAWITNCRLGCASVVTLANQAGRLRWKIENEGFNIQKNHGYELEHAYSENPWVAKSFYFLLQLAHAINQLMIKGSLLPDFEKLLGSIRNFLKRLAESLRQTFIDPQEFDPNAPTTIQIRLDSS